MKVTLLVLVVLSLELALCGEDPAGPLTVIAIGDAGTSGAILRANASYISQMYTGQHDAGKYGALIFLGDNFTPTGLNVPASSVDGEIASSLGPFKLPMDGLGRERVQAIPGEHDYYARNALESSVFFGLIKVQEGPSGISDKGNARAAGIPGWTFHYGMPGKMRLPLETGSSDSVEFIFFDSALLLRSDPARWSPILDSLRRMLRAEQGRAGTAWRIICTHHPLASVGEHGGYSIWNEDESTVEYLTGCDKDSNASGWVRNWLDPQDLCATRYRQYIDSLTAVLHGGQVSVQVVLSSHDRSLQALQFDPATANCPTCPRVQIVSGAGSETGRVKRPVPPREFTASSLAPEDQGLSAPGFVQMRFSRARLQLVFYHGKSGNPIDMGGGSRELWIDVQGSIVTRGAGED
jgi:hypothetical protein